MACGTVCSAPIGQSGGVLQLIQQQQLGADSSSNSGGAVGIHQLQQVMTSSAAAAFIASQLAVYTTKIISMYYR